MRFFTVIKVCDEQFSKSPVLFWLVEPVGPFFCRWSADSVLWCDYKKRWKPDSTAAIAARRPAITPYYYSIHVYNSGNVFNHHFHHNRIAPNSWVLPSSRPYPVEFSLGTQRGWRRSAVCPAKGQAASTAHPSYSVILSWNVTERLLMRIVLVLFNRSRNNSRLFVHGAKRRQSRQSRSHVKIVNMRRALADRRISRIDMPPQVENTEMMLLYITV